MSRQAMRAALARVYDRFEWWEFWWTFKAWFHRCPECHHRPDFRYDNLGHRWEDDKTAAMLGIAQYGCRRCGHGATEERDARRPTRRTQP